MADVFISYKAEEFREADWVRTGLENRGISCWMAPKSIPGGSSYAEEIPRAIREARVFVLILSRQCQLSKWVPRELDQAINGEKTILPFMLEDCPLQDDFSFYLSNVQRYDAYADKADALERMARQIRAILDAGREKREESPPAAEPAAGEEPAGPERTPKKQKERREKLPKPEKRLRESRPGGGRKKKWWIIPAALSLIVLALVLRSAANRVTLAGKTYKRSDASVSIKGQTLTADDISSLKRFRSLKYLYLTDCTLPERSLETIFGKVEYRLELNGCGLTDGDLAAADLGQTTVAVLYLDDNPLITDLSGLSAMGERLQKVSFARCGVTDISFVRSCADLNALNGDGNGITDLSPLSGCGNLTELRLAENGLTSLAPLETCVKLETLDVRGNGLTELRGLEPCIRLKRLDASDNRIGDLGGLENATLLTEVRLGNNEIEDIACLSKSGETLRIVDLSRNRLTSLEALRDCTGIEELRVSGNQLTSQSLLALEGWESLQLLEAADNRITDLTALENCRRLRYLDLSGNGILDTRGIHMDEEAYSLTLDLSCNDIRQLEIPGLKYRYLSIYGNAVTDYTALYAVTGTTLALDYSDLLDLEALKKTGFIDYYLFDCPLDRQVGAEDCLGKTRTHFTTREEYAGEP